MIPIPRQKPDAATAIIHLELGDPREVDIALDGDPFKRGADRLARDDADVATLQCRTIKGEVLYRAVFDATEESRPAVFISRIEVLDDCIVAFNSKALDGGGLVFYFRKVILPCREVSPARSEDFALIISVVAMKSAMVSTSKEVI